MEELKYIIFRLGEQKYGMNLMHVSGIERDYNVIPIPNAPFGVVGLINLRGEVIPIYSLHERFRIDDDENIPNKCLLVTKSSGIMLAYEVDEVLSIAELKKENINEMPFVASNEDTKFIEEVLHIDQDIMLAINVDKVLSEEIRTKISNIIEESKEK